MVRELTAMISRVTSSDANGSADTLHRHMQAVMISKEAGSCARSAATLALVKKAECNDYGSFVNLGRGS